MARNAQPCTGRSDADHATSARTAWQSTSSPLRQRCGDQLAGPGSRRRRMSSSLLRGREQVRHLVRITRELAELPGEPPRLYRRDQARPDGAGRTTELNLEQAGLRGLLRVIGS